MPLIGIAAKPIKRGPMQILDRATITTESGLVEDCRSAKMRSTKRQVTVLSIHQWKDACEELNTILPWYTRRANLCVRGMVFGPSDVGQLLSILSGDDEVLLEVTGETTPCNRMDEAFMGLKQALTPVWRGGVTCRVVQGGYIHLNAAVLKMQPA